MWNEVRALIPLIIGKYIIPIKEKISVKYIVDNLRDKVNINIVACAAKDCCLEKHVYEADLHRPGLALAGYVKLFTHKRIQILGNTENQFLENMSKQKQISTFRNLLKFLCILSPTQWVTGD